MQELVREYLSNVKSRRKRRRRITITITVFAVLVVGSVVWSLARMGIAMTGDPKCGLEEHTHSDACYTDTLVCGQEESAGHTHTDACYQTESVLTCGMEESEEHVHDESCYTTSQTLICGQEESAGHTHTDACYEKTLSCGKEEHTHTENCFIDSGADVEDASAWDAQYADVEWKDAWGEDLVTAAQMQVGYKESTKNYIVAEDGSHKGYTRYGQFAGDAYADWDAPFVNFCLHYAGLEASNMFPNEKATAEWYDTFVKANEQNQNYLTAPAGYEPKPGDIIFFHKEGEETDTQMGIVSSYDKEKNEIKVIEGNSSNEVKENKYDIGDEHISSYLMVTEMEKAHKPSDAGNAEEGKTEAPEDTSKVFTTEENKEETWAYEKSYEDDTIVIHVKAGEGVVPEGAELSVTPIEQKEVTDEMTEEEAAEVEKVNEQYELTNQKLQEESEKKQETLEGFLAYDICFIVDGEEVEPSGDVKVTMDFKEATKPEGVSENAVVAVNHLKEDESAADGVVVEDLTAKADTTIATAEADASVEKVEIVAESFSTFTITWINGNTQSLDVKYIKYINEENRVYEEISLPDQNDKTITLKLNERIDLLGTLEAPAQIDGYNRQKIDALDSNSQSLAKDVTHIEWIYDESFGCNFLNLYHNGESIYPPIAVEGNSFGSYTLLVVYDSKKPVSHTTVDTIDSSKMIDMKMINYDAAQKPVGDKYVNESPFWGAGYADAPNKGIKQGILAKTIDDGENYPKFANGYRNALDGGSSLDNSNLGTFFDGAYNVNNLFLKTRFDAAGHYYYFDSAENAAVLDETTKRFIVYGEQVTSQGGLKPTDENYSSYTRGNFLPYNGISDERPYDNENLYLVEGTPDFHFGLQLSADFFQMENGCYDGNADMPIRYDFTGDDDLWVYIDGVLVLDMGGCHDAKRGYIDFSTGTVYVEDYGTTTLKALFSDALKDSPDDPRLQDAYWNGNTFANYTSHSFKMWYMERGAGASNLKLSFNLPIIPKGEVRVTKKLKDADGTNVNGDYLNEKFAFKVFAQEITATDDKGGETYGDKYVQLFDAEMRDEATGDELQMENGVVWLKPNQTVIFGNAADPRQYYVQEVNLDTTRFDADRVTINETEERTVTTNSNTATIESTKTKVKDRRKAVFTNYLKDEKVKDLTITKSVKNPEPGQENAEFEIAVDFNLGTKEEPNWVPYTGAYIVKDKENNQIYPDPSTITDTTDILEDTVTDESTEGETQENTGRIRIREGYIITIPGLIEGMQYRVYETDTGGFKGEPTYKVNGTVKSASSLGNNCSGIIDSIGNTSERVEIINSNGYDSNETKNITFTKIWDDYENHFETRPPEGLTVTLTGTVEEGKIYDTHSETITEPTEENSDSRKWSCRWDGLKVRDEAGNIITWTVTEQIDSPYADFYVASGPISGDGSDYDFKYKAEDIENIFMEDSKEKKADIKDSKENVASSSQDENYYIVNELNLSKFEWKILKQSTSEPNPLLQNAEFELVKGNGGVDSVGETKITVTSDAEGVIFKDSSEQTKDLDGVYTLTETKAPEGYHIGPKQSWQITFKNGVPVKIDGLTPDEPVVNGGVAMLIYRIENKPLFALPDAGGSGIYWYMFSGILLMAVAVLITYKKRRKGVLRS